MQIYLTNSLSKQKEIFKPIDLDHVTIYACGPTVYDRPHLGNARSAVVYDVLFRFLKSVYKNVTYARNITDVDDKIIAACLSSGIEFKELTEKTTSQYHEDMQALNCLLPTREPKATEYIQQMIEMIQALIERGHAYEVEGHVLFSVKSFSEYGKLSNRSRDEMIAGARVEIAPFKNDPADFVLWKPSSEKEFAFGFDSPWGRGRPGWHIECSAMTRAILGDNFDIHGGGADLMFPHHENEIAQSECSSDHNHFANYWVHNGFLMVDGEKMSKSLGNFKTVKQVLEEGEEGCVIRYFYLTTHYRKPIDFNQKAIKDAGKTVAKFRQALAKFNGEIVVDEEFQGYLADDLNTPLYLAKMHEYASKYLRDGDAIAQLKLASACDLIGLDLTEQEAVVPEEVRNLAELRNKARLKKNWKLADELRAKIVALGFEVMDGKSSEEMEIVKLNR
jgi:cysteinyl-tRNA synthetase